MTRISARAARFPALRAGARAGGCGDRSSRARRCASSSAPVSAPATTSPRGRWRAHMGAHIPGNPTVIVQNQPGAGGAIMTNSLYATGPFDGTVIGAPFNGTPTMPLLSPQSARFDAEKLSYIGSTNRETQVMYVWSHGAGADARRRQDHRAGDGRAGARLDAIRLSGAARSPARLQIQGRHRLREHAEDSSGAGARRGAGHHRQLVDLEGAQFQLARRQQNPAAGAMGAARSCRASATFPRSSISSRPMRTAPPSSSWWRGSNTAGRSLCRRACRPTASKHCGAPSMPR